MDDNMPVHRSSDHQATLCRELWNLRTEGTMCDIILDVNGEYLLGHRVILSACSPYLKNCSLNPQSITQDGLVQIKVDNYSFKVCLKLFEFLYTGRLVDFAGPALDEFKRLCAEWEVVGIAGGVERVNGRPDSVVVNESQINTSENQSALLDEYQVVHIGADSAQTINCEKQPKIENTAANEPEDSAWEPPPKKVKAKRGRPKGSKTKKRPHSDNSKLSDDNKKRSADARRVKQKARENKSERPVLTVEQDGMPTEEQAPYDSETDVEDVDDDPDFVADGAAATDQTDNAESKRTRRKRAARTPAAAVKMTDLGMVICPVCDAEFETRAKMQYHKKSVHRNKRQGWCKICHIKFSDRNQLKAHNVESHWKEGMELPTQYICEEEGCNYQTYNRKSYMAHKSFVHQSERSICDLCGKSLKSAASLRQHHLLVHVIALSKDYPCPSCDKNFKSYCGLTRHQVNIHEGGGKQDKLICPHCGKAYPNVSTMSEHLYKKHDVPPPPGKTGYKCKHCAFKTIKLREIKNHELRHRPEKQFSCDLCDRSYPTGRELGRHKLLHTDKCKIWKCAHCPYTTKYGTAALRSHVQVKHEDSRPWVCTICSYRTKLKGNLHKHIRNVHKCQVKTNWTIPKLAEGESCDRYVVAKSSTPKDPPVTNMEAAGEAGNTDSLGTSVAVATVAGTDTVSENTTPSEPLVSQFQNHVMYDAGMVKPLLTPMVHHSGPMLHHGNPLVQKAQPNQFDILSQLTTVGPNMSNIDYSHMSMYHGIDPKLN